MSSWVANTYNVESSFMVMNQVDSSSFDNDKDDDKNPKE